MADQGDQEREIDQPGLFLALGTSKQHPGVVSYPRELVQGAKHRRSYRDLAAGQRGLLGRREGEAREKQVYYLGPRLCGFTVSDISPGPLGGYTKPAEWVG